MKQFLSIEDVPDVAKLIAEALSLKRSPRAFNYVGEDRTLGLVFMNPSLRTRLSTQKAAKNLGMNVLSFNSWQDGWELETDDGAVMDGDTREHVKEAARVVSCYCDIVGLRSVRGAKQPASDKRDRIFELFVNHSVVPIVNMQSTDCHPLQSLADVMTIQEYRSVDRPKIVLTWVPDPWTPPRSVANSFAQWVAATNAELVVTHPEGYELNERFTEGATLEPDQYKALNQADFVYAKSWSATMTREDGMTTEGVEWMITEQKMSLTRKGKFMHCLPVRRNVAVSDAVLDSSSSIVIAQAANREYAAQAVLKRILEWLNIGNSSFPSAST